MTWTLVSSDDVMFSGYCVTLVTAPGLRNCSLSFSFVLRFYVLFDVFVLCGGT